MEKQFKDWLKGPIFAEANEAHLKSKSAQKMNKIKKAQKRKRQKWQPNGKMQISCCAQC